MLWRPLSWVMASMPASRECGPTSSVATCSRSRRMENRRQRSSASRSAYWSAQFCMARASARISRAVEQRHERQPAHLPARQPRIGQHAGAELQGQAHAVEPALGRAQGRVEGDLRSPRHDDEAVGARLRGARVPGVGCEHAEHLLGLARLAEDGLVGEPEREVLVAGPGAEGDAVEPQRAVRRRRRQARCDAPGETLGRRAREQCSFGMPRAAGAATTAAAPRRAPPSSVPRRPR